MYQFLIRVLLVVLLVVTVTGAADTKLSTTWRDPSVTTTNFSKVVMAFITSDADLRRRVEDGLVRRTQRSVAAYTLVPDGEKQDPEALKAHLAKNGVDAAIVVRLVDLEKEMVISTGESWNVGLPTFWDMWGTWGTVMTISTATYAREHKVATVDIILYSVATGKPIWAGRLKETNPKSLRVLLDDLVKAGSAELRKQKLI